MQHDMFTTVFIFYEILLDQVGPQINITIDSESKDKVAKSN